MKKKPKDLPKMNPEKFRLANEGITGESRGLFLGEDGSVSSQKKFYTEVVAHDMLWWRIRAFLSTVSYLTILTPDFFPFQACENFCDALHDVILAPTGSNSRLTLTQCKAAWMTMVSAFHVKIFQTHCTLASLTDNEMFWKHHWAWHSGGQSSNAGSGVPPPPATPNERRLQSELDKTRAQLNNANRWKAGGKQKGRRSGRGNGGGGGGGGGGGQKRFNSLSILIP